MLLGIVVLTVAIYPTVHGQSVAFDQECHILQTLELLETRLQEQDSRLKLQQTHLEQQKSLLEKQETRLEQQQARIRELENQFTVSNQSTNVSDKMIGFTVHTPKDADKPNVIRFTTVITNEGSGYNTSTGDFTCTVPGFYHFSIHVIKQPTSSVTFAYCRIYRNNSKVAFAATVPASTDDGAYYSASTSVILHLSAGDVVYLEGCSAASTMEGRTSFCGFMIRAD